MKYTQTILSNSTRKLLWFEITKMLIAVYEKILSFIISIAPITALDSSLYLAHRARLWAGPGRAYTATPATEY